MYEEICKRCRQVFFTPEQFKGHVCVAALAASGTEAAPCERSIAICKAVLRKIHEWRQIGSDPDVLLESRNLHAELADEMEQVFDSTEPAQAAASPEGEGRKAHLRCICSHQRGDHGGMGPSRGRSGFSCCCIEGCKCQQWRPSKKASRESQAFGWNVEQILVYIWQSVAGEGASEQEYPFAKFSSSEAGKRLRIELNDFALRQSAAPSGGDLDTPSKLSGSMAIARIEEASWWVQLFTAEEFVRQKAEINARMSKLEHDRAVAMQTPAPQQLQGESKTGAVKGAQAGRGQPVGSVGLDTQRSTVSGDSASIPESGETGAVTETK